MLSPPNFDSLPSAIFAQEILSYLSSDDYLSIRSTSKWFLAALHQWDESDAIWKTALQRDFYQGKETNNNQHLQTFRINIQPNQPSSNPSSSSSSKSIFGYTASNVIYTEKSCFASWKQWKKISQLYFNGKSQAAPHFDLHDDERVKNRNVNADYFLRAAIAWTKIEKWLNTDTTTPSSSSSPPSLSLRSRIKDSLMNGVGHKEGRFHIFHRYSRDRHSLDIPYTPSQEIFGAIFSFYDGQDNTISEYPEPYQVCSGLFGGYSAYDRWLSSCLMSTSASLEILRNEIENENGGGQQQQPNYVPITCATLPFMNKNIVLNYQTGDMKLMTGDSVNGSESTQLAANFEDGTIENTQEIGLLWFEEFARRVENNETSESEPLIEDDESSSIHTLYPTINATYPRTGTIDPDIPITSRAVTRGVEILASAVLAPEMGHGHGYYIYSIRIRLLLPGEDGYQSSAQRGFETCQLLSRHWKIKDDEQGGTVDNVDGDGVIGRYPLLREGGYRNDYGSDGRRSVRRMEECKGTFIYQSCSEGKQGSFSGSVLMIPGSLAEPTGKAFHAILAPFALDVQPKFFF